MARWTIYLREKSSRGWEWSRYADSRNWWGYYKTRGLAISAAKRSINPVAGGKTKASDFELIELDSMGNPLDGGPLE